MFERKGDYAQAEGYFEKCLKLKPDFHEAQNYLGYMWADRGEKLDRARELIEQALKAQPENGAYLDSMGWVLFKQNEPKDALDYLLKAAEFTKEPDATLYDHLGDVYAALNEMDKARESWRKSLSVEKNDAVQKKLEAQKSE
jgi:Tfp pilus assembly protein PilF